VAASAVLLVLRGEGLLPVVALAAEITLRDLAHIDLVRALRHLEYLIVAAGALHPFFLYMLFMAEDHRRGILGEKVRSPPPTRCAKALNGTADNRTATAAAVRFFMLVSLPKDDLFCDAFQRSSAGISFGPFSWSRT